MGWRATPDSLWHHGASLYTRRLTGGVMAIARRSAPRALRVIRTTTQPKTTRPPGASRRAPAVPRTIEKQIQQRLDAMPDRIDIRDWLYRPALDPLPDTIVNCDRVPTILNQGKE